MEERTRRPHSYLMDGGFATDITILEHRGVRVYAPEAAAIKSRTVMMGNRRMATEEAKAIYSRCAIGPTPRRGWRALAKVTA